MNGSIPNVSLLSWRPPAYNLFIHPVLCKQQPKSELSECIHSTSFSVRKFRRHWETARRSVSYWKCSYHIACNL